MKENKLNKARENRLPLSDDELVRVSGAANGDLGAENSTMYNSYNTGEVKAAVLPEPNVHIWDIHVILK